MQLYETLADLLDDQVDSPVRIEFIAGQDQRRTLTPAELRAKALGTLGALQSRGMTPGDELIIHTPSNHDFVIAFWAAILGGFVPVPVAVGISDEHRHKFLRILGQLNNPRVFAPVEQRQRLLDVATDGDSDRLHDDARWMSALAGDDAAPGLRHTSSAHELAFIQYSSGSTGHPKGVCLTHKNVTTNVRAIVEAAGWTDSDRALSWMPLTHDMGLIGFHLSVLAAGMYHAIMDTSAFVRRPKLWLSLAAELKCTILCSPNFGYQHYLKAVERKGADTLDLGTVRQILNGAEPISRALCDQFNATLAPSGLAPTAMRPVYGLAEATVGVSFSTPGTPYVSSRIHRLHTRIGDTLERVEAGSEHALDLMHVGYPIRDVQLRIVDDQDRPLPNGTVGHIQLRGDSVTAGIYGDDDASAALFTPDGWLRTGDSGALVTGAGAAAELVIVGRIKDVLISSGQNFYAHDIEQAISDVSGAELGKAAVAAVRNGDSSTEQAAVFVLYRKPLEEFAPLANAVRGAVSARTGLEADWVVPVAKIPKTTSGKIQRHALALAFNRGDFNHTLQADGVRYQPLAADEETVSEASSDPVDVCTHIVGIANDVIEDITLGADDNLFEVGASSLTLADMVLAIDDQYPGKLDITDLFDHPTLREVAVWIQRD